MSTYLSDPLKFEETIRRGFGHSRSRYLDHVIDLIKENAPIWEEDSLEELDNAFNLWLEYEEKEVDFRFSNEKIHEFEDEIEKERDEIQRNVKGMHEPPKLVARSVWLPPASPNRISDPGELERHSGVKMGANVVRNLATPAIPIAQAATHSATLGTVVLGGTAAVAGVGGTALGLMFTGPAIALVSAGMAGRSIYRTHYHIKGLQLIYNSRARFPCSLPSDGCHHIIVDQVLPYIIFQKTKKKERKWLSIIPVVQGVRSLIRKAQKFQSGTLGVKREMASRWLAAHLLRTTCPLVQAVIRELFRTGNDEKDGSRELECLKVCPYEQAWPLLARKLKST